MPSSLAICQFCRITPALPGDFFCCDGCRVLSEIQQTKRSEFEPSPEDHLLTETYGQRIGPKTKFEIYVEPLVCEGCLQSLAKIPQILTSIIEIEWVRAASLLRVQFQEGDEYPTRIFHFLQKAHM